jgi:gluconolactonase
MKQLFLIFVAALAAGQTRPAGAERTEIAAITAFTEGPTVDAEGNVYFTETISERIMKLAPDGKLTVFKEDSNAANGMVFDKEGRLIVCEGSTTARHHPRVVRIDVKTGKSETLAEAWEGKPLNKPNDVTIDGKGRIYFTDPDDTGKSAVYRIDATGSGARILKTPEIQWPNGIMISPDDRTLYLVEANKVKGGARMIRAYDLDVQGNVSHMRVFHDFSPGRSADGMCIDTAGNLYTAAGLHRLRGTSETLDTKPGVHVFSPGGKLIDFIPIPEDTITNCAFGGPDMRTLYVTAGKTLFKARVATPGTGR